MLVSPLTRKRGLNIYYLQLSFHLLKLRTPESVSEKFQYVLICIQKEIPNHV